MELENEFKQQRVRYQELYEQNQESLKVQFQEEEKLKQHIVKLLQENKSLKSELSKSQEIQPNVLVSEHKGNFKEAISKVIRNSIESTVNIYCNVSCPKGAQLQKFFQQTADFSENCIGVIQKNLEDSELLTIATKVKDSLGKSIASAEKSNYYTFEEATSKRSLKKISLKKDRC